MEIILVGLIEQRMVVEAWNLVFAKKHFARHQKPLDVHLFPVYYRCDNSALAIILYSREIYL